MYKPIHCRWRHPNGNCLLVGGFCTAVSKEICNIVHKAYEEGKVNSCTEILHRIKELLPDEDQKLYDENGNPTQQNLIVSCLIIVEEAMRDDEEIMEEE